MTVPISGYPFDGPFDDIAYLSNESGVYVILDSHDLDPDNVDSRNIIDVGESSQIRDRVKDHDRKDCWHQQSIGQIKYAAHYTDEHEREGLERHIRWEHEPPCGEI